MHNRREPSQGGARAAAAETVAPSWLDGPLLRRCDAAGSAHHFDAAWLRFTGRPLEASLHDAWLEDIHPEDRARCVAIHAEMLASCVPYTLDYRLRHAVLGHRWVMERATPVAGHDGRFDGFEFHTVDVHDSTALGEQLAERHARMRSVLHAHIAFAAALADEVERLPAARVKIALDAFAALPREPSRRRPTRRRVAGWLGAIVDDACAALPAGATPFTLKLPGERLEVDFEPAVLDIALTNALVCAASLTAGAMSAEAAEVRAVQVDGALWIELPTAPGSSAVVLLDLALRARGLSGGQVVGAVSGTPRLRVALPLARLPHRGRPGAPR